MAKPKRKQASRKRKRNQLAKKRKQVATKISNATVLIYYAVDGPPLIQDRSGVLVKLGDRHFIWTATHELNDWIDSEFLLFTSTGNVVYHEPSDRGPETVELIIENRIELDDVHDCSILELAPKTVQMLESSKHGLEADDLALLHSPTEGAFRLFGYPFEEADPGDSSDAKPRVESNSMSIDAVPGNPSLRSSHVSEDHLVLTHSPDICFSGGTLISESEITGISGGGLWLLPNGDSSSRVRLVGIFHRSSSTGNYVVGTSLHPICDAIAHKYPDLANAVGQVVEL